MSSSLLIRTAVMSAVALLLIVIVLLARVLHIDSWYMEQAIGIVNSLGSAGPPMLFLVGASITAVGLPRQFVAFLAGFSYGFAFGALLSLAAALVGCAITTIAARRLLGRWVASRYPAAVGALQRLIRHDAFLKILFLRLQPFGTNLMTNLCAGLTDLRLRVFIAASAVGYLPQTVVFALLGSGIRRGSILEIQSSIVMFITSLILGGWLYRRHLQRLESVEGAVASHPGDG